MKRGKIMSVNEKDIILSLLKINECLCFLLLEEDQYALYAYKAALIKELESLSVLYGRSFINRHKDIEEELNDIDPIRLFEKINYSIIYFIENNSILFFQYFEGLYFYLKEMENV